MSKSKLKTVKIQKTEYVMVNEKVKYFRSEDQYKGWAIVSDIYKHEGDDIIIRTSIKNTEGVVISTGIAHEVAGSNKVNSTSHIENCETSAIGRALAGLGIGIDSSYSSHNEVAMAIDKQNNGIVNTKTKEAVPGEVFKNAMEYLKEKTPQERPMALEKIRKQKGDKITPAQYKKLEAIK